jgi:hypothetical protein
MTIRTYNVGLSCRAVCVFVRLRVILWRNCCQRCMALIELRLIFDQLFGRAGRLYCRHVARGYSPTCYTYTSHSPIELPHPELVHPAAARDATARRVDCDRVVVCVAPQACQYLRRHA